MQPSTSASVESTIGVNSVHPFDHQRRRRHFILKVYALLSVCVSVTIVHVSVVLFCETCRQFLFDHSWIFWIAFLSYIIASSIIACCMAILQDHVVGFVMFGIIVESLSIICVYLVTVIATTMQVRILFLIQLSYSLFALIVIGVLFILLLIVSVELNFFKIRSKYFMPILQLAIAFASIIVFSIHMIFMTRILLGGKNYHFVENNLIPPAVFLYVDFILLFLNILSVNFFCLKNRFQNQ